MASRQAPLTLIVAMTSKNGIGKDNGLPWPMLKKEMAYFARVTQHVPPMTTHASTPARNVVIMGRKTWDGIPTKFRPLKNRTNLVITRSPDKFSASLAGATGDASQVIAASSIEAGLDELDRRVDGGGLPPAGRVFVIGGASIYAAAMHMSSARHILLTRVERATGGVYECDTFFPVDVDEAGSGWTEKSLAELKDFTGEAFDGGDAVFQEKDGDAVVSCTFKLYQKS